MEKFDRMKHPELAPEIGWPVQWLAGVKPGTTVYAARVTGVRHNGMVDVVFMTPAGGDTIARKNVRHASDPHFDKYPDTQSRDGVWRYLTGMEYQPSEDEIAKYTDEQEEIIKAKETPKSEKKPVKNTTSKKSELVNI